MNFTAFLLIAVVLIVTPGQDTALTIRNTLAGGRRAGVFTAAGVAAGQATWTVLTALGLSTLLVVYQPAFAVLRYAGAAYLCWLGIQAIRSALRRDGGWLVSGAGAGGASSVVALRQGMLSNLGNAKMIAFFPSLLPQFLPAGGAMLPMALLLGFLFCLMTLGWLTAYAFVVARAGDLLRRGRVRRAIEASSGAVLLSFGLRVATE